MRPPTRRSARMARSWATPSSCATGIDFPAVPPTQCDYMDVSPRQIVSVRGAHPVPGERRRQPRPNGLEHAAPRRPLLNSERPIVRTGVEYRAGRRLRRGGAGATTGIVERVTARGSHRRRDGELDFEIPHRCTCCAATRPRASPSAPSSKRAIACARASHRRWPVHRSRPPPPWARTCWSRSCPGKATTTRTPS